MTQETDILDDNGFNTEKRPLCPFCSKPWSDAMVDVEFEAAMYCETCGVEKSWIIDITCDGCDRLIYRKEGY